MALIIRIARLIAQLGEALDEALEARDEARRKYPFVPEE
jgi:hypothetical protein